MDFLENVWEFKFRFKEYRFRNLKFIFSFSLFFKNALELNIICFFVLYKCKICKRVYLKLFNLEKYEKFYDDKNGKKLDFKKLKKLRYVLKVKEKLEKDVKFKRNLRFKKYF